MLKRHLLGHGGSAWALAWRSAAAAWTAGHGCTGLQAADGDDLLSGPDLKREGAGAAADNGEGTIVQQLERQHGAAAADPDQAGGEELIRQLAGQAGSGVIPGQRKSRNI
jgi:hypothetical protein